MLICLCIHKKKPIYIYMYIYIYIYITVKNDKIPPHECVYTHTLYAYIHEHIHVKYVITILPQDGSDLSHIHAPYMNMYLHTVHEYVFTY
jgi:hypothetical protein